MLPPPGAHFLDAGEAGDYPGSECCILALPLMGACVLDAGEAGDHTGREPAAHPVHGLWYHVSKENYQSQAWNLTDRHPFT